MARLFKLGFDDPDGLLRHLQLRFTGSLMPKAKMKVGVVVTVYKGALSSVYLAKLGLPV